MAVTLIDNFDKLYPHYHTEPLDGCCVVEEVEAEDAEHCFRSLTIKECTGRQFPHMLPKDATSFYNMSQRGAAPELLCEAHNVLREDCDGIFFSGGTLYFVELKSSFTEEAIVKAKNQIVGSYFKVRTMLALLQGYSETPLRVCGVIAAFEPDTIRLSAIKDPSSRKSQFCLKLVNNRYYRMPKVRCDEFWHPVDTAEIAITYVSIPRGHKSFEVSLADIGLPSGTGHEL